MSGDNIMNFPAMPPGRGSGDKGSGPSDTGNGNGTGGGDLERRIETLEKAIPDIRERLARLESKVDSVALHGATKTEIESVKTSIASLESTLLKWFIGTAIALSGMAFTAAKLIH